MRMILRIIVGFAVVAALTLGVMLYLEQRQGVETHATAILDDIKDAGRSVGDSIDGFLEDTGIKEGAANLMEEGAALIKGSSQAPTPKPEP